MVGRTFTRSTPSRDQASSPPTKPSQRVKKAQSPAARTRVTRSESRDLDSDPDNRTRKTARSRGVREGSTESLGSNASNDNKGGRRRKNTRAAAAITHDLSVVGEELEEEQVERQLADMTENPQVSQSSSGQSRLSGTTALTTQSTQKMDDLDVGMMVELIPDLSREAFRLVELLIPTPVSPAAVTAIVNELQVPGSGRGKRLRLREKTFYSTMENYGNDSFIDPLLVLRKLFDKQDLDPGQFRPDIVFHAANIATLVKELLVAQRDNPNIIELLQRLDDAFPTLFLSGYESDPKFGTSALLEATFDLALDLRTQTVIAIFKAYRHEMNYDPDQLLAELFYEPPEQRNESVSTFEELIINGRLRRIAGICVEALPLDDKEVLDSQSARLRQRVEMIRSSFYLDEDAIADGEYVDFDELNDRFSWRNFLANVVGWSQLRLDEIRKGIEVQGGLDNIVELLIEQIKGSNKQIEFYANPTGVVHMLQTQGSNTGIMPPLPIIPASAGKSLYKSSKSLHTLVEDFEPNLSAPPSNQQRHSATLREKDSTVSPTQGTAPILHGPSRNNYATGLERAANPEGEQPAEVQELMSDSGASSIAEVLTIHDVGELYTIKENRPINGHGDRNVAKPRFIDRQLNAERVPFDDDDDDPVDQTNEVSQDFHPAGHDDEEVDDDDENAFQRDNRPLDASRRRKAALPVAPTSSLMPPPLSLPKRRLARLQEDQEDEPPTAAAHRPGKRRSIPEQESAQDEGLNENEVQERALQASARLQEDEKDDTPTAAAHRPGKRRRIPEQEPAQDEELDENEVQERALQASARAGDEPSASYASITETARASVAATTRRLAREPRKRTVWSEDESQLLMELIARHGSNWSKIEKIGRDVFSDSGRDQVALRDKARNMKVNYLLCGIDLPIGFDAIALGKKEKDRVKAAGFNPYRLESELVGEESHDMDGLKVISP